jgi:putative colanic acid biosysnthesis UDP-glucose lipid carrier transferase
MPETPASTGSLSSARMRDRLSWFRPRASSMLGNGSVADKAVSFGSLEPVHITLARHSILPLIVVLMLAICTLASGQSLSVEFCALGLVAFLTSAQVFSPLDLCNYRPAERARRFVSRMLLEWSCVVLVLLFLSVAFKLTHVFSRDTMLDWFLTTPIALLLADSLCIPVVKWLAASAAQAKRYIIVGVNEVGIELARRLKQIQTGGRFCGFLDYRSPERLSAILDAPLIGNCVARDFADFVRNKSIDRVYLALPMAKAPRIEELLRELGDTTASVYFVPNIFAFDLVQARCVEINGMPVFSICDSPLHGMSGFWKHFFDVALASIALLLIWPVLAATALAIRLTSPGPALFKQRRYGLNGEEILIYKFRTMTVCEDGSSLAQATKHDRRVTRLGAFLRRTSLDELPQIINVLEGKMSFVGPRPHAVAHNEEYRRLISGYMLRHKVRPGITGWAQVNGLRGETSTVDKMHQRVQYDLDYLKNWSLGLDLKIMARTASAMFYDRNAY